MAVGHRDGLTNTLDQRFDRAHARGAGTLANLFTARARPGDQHITWPAHGQLDAGDNSATASSFLGLQYPGGVYLRRRGGARPILTSTTVNGAPQTIKWDLAGARTFNMANGT